MGSNEVVVKNIRQLVTLQPLTEKEQLTGIKSSDLGILEKAYIHSRNGKVVGVGTGELPPLVAQAKVIDAQNGLVMPGFVDMHTHPLFAGDRSREFGRKLEGATYQEIAESGGGIKETVRGTLLAQDDELVQSAKERCLRCLALGTTTMEVKSGYGLTPAEELRHLRLLNQVKSELDQHVSVTALLLHAIPGGATQEAVVEGMIKEALPVVKQERLADAVDLFVEQGYFDASKCEGYAQTARDLGLKICVHADEFTDAKGALFAAKWGARSADHLQFSPESSLTAMAEAGVTAVLLPGTSLYSKIPFAKADKFRGSGCEMAIATDFNPGSSNFYNLAFIACLAAVHCGLTQAETIAGITMVPAKSLGLSKSKGAIAPGFDADFLIYDSMSFDQWFENFGQRRPDHVYLEAVEK